MKGGVCMLRTELLEQLVEENLRIYSGATAVSLSDVDGTYTGTAPSPRENFDAIEG
jgi:hypothetical protein